MATDPHDPAFLPRLDDTLGRVLRERDVALATVAHLKHRLVDRAAWWCAQRGWTRVALYGAGRHTAPIARQPWAWHGITVVAVLDDAPRRAWIAGVPVLRPHDLREPVDAVVVSSDAYEDRIAARAEAVFGPRGVPVVRLYGESPARGSEDEVVARLVSREGLREDDARWLVVNRSERHDATLPMLPPERTELHLRRYELACRATRGARVLDVACGTGYGSALLLTQGGAASVTGVDVDARTVEYARARFGRPGRAEFRVGDACATGLPDGAFDAVTSFETIEHLSDPGAMVRELHRVTTRGARLILSTPFEGPLTDHHAHSFTRASLGEVVGACFEDLEWFGQVAGDHPVEDDLPPGVFRWREGGLRPHTMLVMATRRG